MEWRKKYAPGLSCEASGNCTLNFITPFTVLKFENFDNYFIYSIVSGKKMITFLIIVKIIKYVIIQI